MIAPLTFCSKFQLSRKEDEEMEDLKVHIVWVITDGSKHLAKPECTFTWMRKKTTIDTSGVSKEAPN